MNKQKPMEQITQGMMERARPSDYWLNPKMGFPELEDSRFVIQGNGQSVRDHTMDVIDVLEDKNPITLLSGLFHDLGKCVILPQNKNRVGG